MVVCLCNRITDQQLKESIKNGITTVKALRQELGIGEYCGCCAAIAKEYIIKHSSDSECKDSIKRTHCNRIRY